MSRVTTYDVVDMKEVYQSECEHKNTTYQPREYDTNVAESYSCDECGLELELPEPEEDTMRGEDR